MAAVAAAAVVTLLVVVIWLFDYGVTIFVPLNVDYVGQFELHEGAYSPNNTVVVVKSSDVVVGGGDDDDDGKEFHWTRRRCWE